MSMGRKQYPASIGVCGLAIGLLIGGSGLCAGALQAQQAATLEPLVVQATGRTLELGRLPAAITVIDGEQLEDGPMPTSLADVLAMVPGLFVQGDANFAQDARISLRGFGAQSAFGIRGVAILVDGIPQTLPDGQAQIDAIDLRDIERIEILRGPASALYGNAAGGVILITTRPVETGVGFGLEQALGEYGLRQTRANARFGGAHAGVRVTLGRLSSDGYREHARADQRRAALKLGWQPVPATRVDARLDWFDAPEEQDPGALTASDAHMTPRMAHPRNVSFDAGEALTQWRLGTQLNHRLVDGSRLRLGLYTLQRDFANRLPFADGGQVALNRHYTGLNLAHELRARWLPERLTLGWGLEWRRQRDERERFDNLNGVRGDRVLAQQEQVQMYAAWLQSTLTLSPHWSLTAALRQDVVRLEVTDRLRTDGDDSGARRFSQSSPWLGLSWQPDPQLTVYAHYGRAFQTPTTTELANPEDPASGGGFNPLLGPETADSLELGLRWRSRFGHALEASVYRIEVDDAITSIEVPGFSGTGREFFANAGRSTRRGLELGADWPVAASIAVQATWSWTDFVFDRFVTADGDFSGNRLPGVPRRRGTLGVRWTGPRGLDGRLQWIHTGGFAADNANSTRVSARTELSVSAGWTVPVGRTELRVAVGVENLLDQRYPDNVRVNAFGGRFFEPAADRHGWISARIGWR
ncbi:MAG: TonB-dependent receptor [Wenzhouxiangellaceae bacterium]